MIEMYLNSLKAEKRDYLGMSAIGYCPLQNFYLLNNSVEKQVPANVLERFEIAKALHARVIKFFIDNYPERYISGDYDPSLELVLETKAGQLKGHFDLFDKQEKKVIDFKFYDHSGWSMVKEPHNHYVAQLTLYIEALNKKGLECLGGELIYISTKTFQEKIFNIEPDSFYAEQLVNIFVAIMNKDIKELKRISPLEEWQCKYCQFNQECENAKTEKTIERFTVLSSIDTQKLAELIKQKKEIEEEIEGIKAILPEGVNYEDNYVSIKTIETTKREIDKNKLIPFLKAHNAVLSDFETTNTFVFKKINLK